MTVKKIKPTKPSDIVAETLLVFLRAIFDENYKKGNWHLDPKNEMYIRMEFPQDIQKLGSKPGIIVGKSASVSRGIHYLGEHNYIPMQMQNINAFNGSDEIFSGRLNIITHSVVEEEAEDVAYLIMLSINRFADEILGINGIAHIDADGYTDASPSSVSVDYKYWQSQVPIMFVIKIPYGMRNMQGDTLENIDVDYKEK